MPLKGRTSWNKIRHSEICRNSSTEVLNLKYRSKNPKLLRSQFVHLFRLAFQNKKSVEHSNIVFGLFLGVFIFLSVSELFY